MVIQREIVFYPILILIMNSFSHSPSNFPFLLKKQLLELFENTMMTSFKDKMVSHGRTCDFIFYPSHRLVRGTGMQENSLKWVKTVETLI